MEMVLGYLIGQLTRKKFVELQETEQGLPAGQITPTEAEELISPPPVDIQPLGNITGAALAICINKPEEQLHHLRPLFKEDVLHEKEPYQITSFCGTEVSYDTSIVNGIERLTTFYQVNLDKLEDFRLCSSCHNEGQRFLKGKKLNTK